MGGTFQATVDCAADQADRITVNDGMGNGKLFVGGTATLVVLPLNYDANNGLGAGFSRRVIYAREGIANVVPQMAPSLALQNPAAPIFQLNLTNPNNGPSWYDLVPGPGQN